MKFLPATLATILLFQGGSSSPKEVLQTIARMYAQERSSVTAGNPPTADLGAKVARAAAEALVGVDLAKIPVEQAGDYMRLFDYAGDHKSATALAKRAYQAKSIELMDLNARVFRSLVQEGDFNRALFHVRNADFSAGPAMIGQFHAGAKGALQEKAVTNPKEVLAIYDALLERVHFGSPATDSDRNWGPVVYGDIESERILIAGRTEPKAVTLRKLKALEAKLAPHKASKNAFGETAVAGVTARIRILEGTDTQSAMLGKPAPGLEFDQSLNFAEGLPSLKGKVLVLDFMAHWCGPCKRAFPDLAKLQTDLGGKGVQVVSLTSYYGYYEAKQGLTPTQEFEEMKKFIRGYAITWPMLFDAKKVNSTRFGVTGIPHLVVIDRAGVVRKVEVGYTPESFAQTRKLVEDLAAK